MKKFALLLAAGLMLGGAVMAQDETGALGFGIISESSKNAVVSKNIRFSLFLDAGTKLYGPFHYGFEFQGDVKKLTQTTADLVQTDVTAYGLGGNDWILFITTNKLGIDATLWDLDFSPRGYISFDLADKIQLLGFAGLNYNWQTLDTKYTNKNAAGTITLNDGTTIQPGGSATYSNSLDGTWSLIAGLRISVGAFYLDYTRFLQSNDSGDYTFNQFNKDRLGLGISLRF